MREIGNVQKFSKVGMLQNQLDEMAIQHTFEKFHLYEMKSQGLW